MVTKCGENLKFHKNPDLVGENPGSGNTCCRGSLAKIGSGSITASAARNPG